MKNSILFIALGLLTAACGNSNKPQKASTDAVFNEASADTSQTSDKGVPAITWVKVMHDFGKITQGEKAEYSFKFTNTGSGQLLISNAVATCGCTVPQYSKEPINPGESGFIKVIFDSEKRLDRFEKSITITSNTSPAETVLYITGMVIPKPEEQERIMNQ
ncbi:MAG: DUF1573 domain-containing protein [Bacteroidia bacterium]